MINEYKIKCFLCVAEARNFTDAANRLFISQQAVSRHIADFEKDIGIKLFVRDHHHVKLTKAGLRFQTFFLDCIAGFEFIKGDLLTHTKEALTIHIGYQNWIVFGDMPGTAMKQLRKSYKDIFFVGERHSPSTLLKYLDSGKLDVILIHSRFVPPHYSSIATNLFETPMYLYVSKTNAKNVDEDEKNMGYSTFLSLPLIIDSLDDEPAESTELRALRECKKYGFTPNDIIVVPNRDSVYMEAEMGRGIFFGSAHPLNMENENFIHCPLGVSDWVCAVCKPDTGVKAIDDYVKNLVALYAN